MSGGMRQRVMIAMALACKPAILIADEPTTALDVTIQAQILELLKRLQAELGMAVVLITHDLGVVAETADRVVVMYAGQVVESCDVRSLFRRTLHPYTAALLRSLPRIGSREPLRVIPGSVPNPAAFPPGCRFAPRCPVAEARCLEPVPPGASSKSATACAACAPPRSRPGASSRRRWVRTPVSEYLLEVRDLTKHFPIRRGLFSHIDRPGAGGGRGLVLDPPGRGAGAGGGERLRQDHHRSLRAAAHRADFGLGALRWAGNHRRSGGERCARCVARCRSSSRIRTRA